MPVGSVYSMACKAVALADQGDFFHAHDSLDWALAAVGGSGHEIESSLLNMRGAVLLWQGRWRETLEGAIQSQAIAARVYAPYLLAMAHALEDYAGWMLERDSARIESLEQTCHWLEGRQQRLFISFAYGWLADCLVATGDHRRACHYAGLALQRAKQQDRVGEAMACRALAEVAARSAGLASRDEEEYFDLALESARDRGSAHERAVTLLHRARRQIERGEVESGQTLLKQVEQAFATLDMRWHQSQAAHLLNQMSRPRAH